MHTLRWRDEFKIDEVMQEEFPADIFGNLGHIYGRDKQGRPITYLSSAPRGCTHMLMLA